MTVGCAGLHPNVGEAAQKISREEKAPIIPAIKEIPYTQKEVDSCITLAQGVREGILPNSQLEQLVEFLEKLKQ